MFPTDPVRMHVRSCAGIVFLAIVSTVIWLAFSPSPLVREDPPTKGRERAYRAGGSACTPRSLEVISSLSERNSRADLCAQAEENYRLQQDNLHQAKRSAQAAEQGVLLGYRQLQGTVFQGILLIWTLAATAWAALAAAAAAQAAKESVIVSRQGNELQLRAYVASKETHLTAQYDPADPTVATGVEVVVFWENVGSTPARNVQTGLFRQILPGAIPDDFEYECDGLYSPYSSIGPRQTHRISMMVTQADLSYLSKTGNLFVWSFVEYDDIFPTSPRHRTEVCSEILFNGDPRVANPKIDMRIRGRFNGFDEDCYYQPSSLTS